MKGSDFVRQRDAMQCGGAALTMVCRHFGARYSLDFVAGSGLLG
ncbi:MAG: ABC transporter, partial [Muribaculaceae bacterium]|nr:ABC transporter [Muribaculaceae bacterium]